MRAESVGECVSGPEVFAVGVCGDGVGVVVDDVVPEILGNVARSRFAREFVQDSLGEGLGNLRICVGLGQGVFADCQRAGDGRVIESAGEFEVSHVAG